MQFINTALNQCFNNPDSFFNYLPETLKNIISEHCNLSELKRGEYIFIEGKYSYGVPYLVTGKVKIIKEGSGGRHQIIRLLKPHCFIPDQNLLSDAVCTATAMVLEDSVVCYLSRESVLKAIRTDPDLALRIIKSLSDELLFSINHTMHLTQKHMRGRLAETLITLKNIYGFENDKKILDIKLSRQELANFSNMTTSNAIRTLSALASENIIELRGKKITILDSDQLERISKTG
jgi:CRP/FNR family transcriptional regulator, polysaccharide utilization system transcription regulator